MRHEQVNFRESFDVVDVAAIWPRPDGGVQAPLGELDQPATTAAPDMPAAIGRGIVIVYSALIAIFFVTMGLSGEASFMIAISGFYLAMFLAVPRIFLAVERDRSTRPDLARFLSEGIHTNTGHMSGTSALAQIFAVPVLLTLAILVIGVAALVILP